MGFEPTIRFPVYTLSKRAPSTARPPLPLFGNLLKLAKRGSSRNRAALVGQAFRLFLDGKSVTFAIGNAYRTQTNIVQALIHSFEFGLPRATIDALATGGSVTIQRPTGKRDVIKVPASQTARARFNKCFAGNGGR